MRVKIVGLGTPAACSVTLVKSSDTPSLADPEFREAFLLAPRPVTVAVCLPLYTESGYILQRTLAGLAMQQEDLRRCAFAGTPATNGGKSSTTDTPTLHVLVIADGNAKLSDSMRSYLQELFPAFTSRTFDPSWYDEGMDLERGGSSRMPKPDPTWTQRAQLAIFNRIEAYKPTGPVHDPDDVQAEEKHLRKREDTSQAAGVITSRLARMPSRTTLAARQTSPYDSGSIPGTASTMDSADETDNAYCISPVEIDITHAIMSVARRSELQHVLSGSAYSAAGAGLTEEIKRRLYVSLDTKRRMYVTLVVKQQNRKKHNSNRLFFDVFSQLCTTVNFTRYYFCTDAGTLYSPHMLCILLGHMENNKDCGACCGHQRIMHSSDQMDPVESVKGERESWGLWALRSIQGADFDQGLCTFNGVHSRLGFLPVIPGPCGLFRASAVTEDVLEEVNEVCAKPNSLDDILTANLRLAEDRVISYLIILRSPSADRTVTSWVPTATFYFECEESLRELVLQRRRWLNGTLAGYPWLLKRQELWGSVAKTTGARYFQSLAILLLCLAQMLIYFMCLTMPAFIGVIGHLTISAAGLISTIIEMPLSDDQIFNLYVFHWVIYGGSWLLHMYIARFNKLPYNWVMWYFRVTLNALTIFGNAIAMLALFSLSLTGWGAAIAKQIGDEALTSFWVAFTTGLLYAGTPFVLSYMHSPAALQSLSATFAVYYVFIPSIVSDFLTYSLCRLDDWSWGNKDKMTAGSKLEGASTNSRGLTQTDYVANVTPLIIVVGNALLTALVMHVAFNYKSVIVAMGEAITSVGLVIMFCSALFFLMRRERLFVTSVVFTAWCIAALSVMAITSYRHRDDKTFRFFFLLFFCSHGFFIVVIAIEMIVSKLFCKSPAESSPGNDPAHTELVASICAKMHRAPVVRADQLSDALEVPTVEVGRWNYILSALATPLSPFFVLVVFLIEQMRWTLGAKSELSSRWRMPMPPVATAVEEDELLGQAPVGFDRGMSIFVTTLAVPALRPYLLAPGDALPSTVTMLRLLFVDHLPVPLSVSVAEAKPEPKRDYPVLSSLVAHAGQPKRDYPMNAPSVHLRLQNSRMSIANSVSSDGSSIHEDSVGRLSVADPIDRGSSRPSQARAFATHQFMPPAVDRQIIARRGSRASAAYTEYSDRSTVRSFNSPATSSSLVDPSRRQSRIAFSHALGSQVGLAPHVRAVVQPMGRDVYGVTRTHASYTNHVPRPHHLPEEPWLRDQSRQHVRPVPVANSRIETGQKTQIPLDFVRHERSPEYIDHPPSRLPRGDRSASMPAPTNTGMDSIQGSGLATRRTGPSLSGVRDTYSEASRSRVSRREMRKIMREQNGDDPSMPGNASRAIWLSTSPVVLSHS